MPAVLATSASCPFCGSHVTHVVKQDPALSDVAEQVKDLAKALAEMTARVSSFGKRPDAPLDLNARGTNEDSYFSDA